MSPMYLPRNSAPLPPEVTLQIRRLARKDNGSFDRLRSVANIIYGWNKPQGEDLYDDVMQWYRLMMGFHQSLGEDGSFTDAYLFQMCDIMLLMVTRLYASDLELSDRGRRMVVEVRDILARTAREGNPVASFMHRKAQQLCYEYLVRHHGVTILKGHFDKEGWDLLKDIELPDDSEIEEIATSLTQLRAYGVKPCVISDGLLHPDKLCWVFNSGAEFTEQVSASSDTGFVPPLAVTHLTDIKTVKRLRPKLYGLESTSAKGVSLGFLAMMAASIHPDGSLTSDAEGAITLEKVFRDASILPAYPLFRLIHLLRLYDLVVPLNVMREQNVPEWPSVKKGGLPQLQPDQMPTLWRTLVIPRLRILRDTEALQSAMNREVQEGIELTEQLARKRHDVTGFLRPLPKGCVASERARALALQERGFVIPDGYTYVKDHKRGTRESPFIGYKTRRRSDL